MLPLSAFATKAGLHDVNLDVAAAALWELRSQHFVGLEVQILSGSHMCALMCALSYVCSYVLLYVCSHMLANLWFCFVLRTNTVGDLLPRSASFRS